MKKTLLLFCLFGAYQAQAQIGFNPGIRAGANFSTLTSIEGSTKTDFYAGVFGAIKLAPFYTLQPELNYSRQGMDKVLSDIPTPYFPEEGGEYITYIPGKEELSLQYLGINVMNKFEYKKFGFMIGPGLDFIVNKPKYVSTEVDLTINLGLNYDVTESFGIEARFKKGFIEPYADYGDFFFSDEDRTTNSVFQVGLYYKIK